MAAAIIAAALGCTSPRHKAPGPARRPLASETPPNTNDPGSPQGVPPFDTYPPAPFPPNPGAIEGGAYGMDTPDIGDEGAVPPPRPDGQACFTSAECASGVCEGLGCEATPGKCAPQRRGCTRDLRTYCGCDGKTFRASGSCPGRRFASYGACPM